MRVTKLVHTAIKYNEGNYNLSSICFQILSRLIYIYRMALVTVQQNRNLIFVHVLADSGYETVIGLLSMVSTITRSNEV